MSAGSGTSTRPRWRPSLVVVGVLLILTLGGWLVAAALAEPVGPPVGFQGVVTVQPLSGWEFAGQRDVAGAPLVRLTRGGGNLDIVAFEPLGEDGRTLAARYVSSVLRLQLDRLSVSNRFSDVALQDGTPGLRFTYAGVATETGQSIEGEVTVVVTSTGNAVVFDAWAAEGLFAYAQGDLHTMIARAVLS
jgi:hypothetical protein